MLKQLLKETELAFVFLNCDESEVRNSLENVSVESIIGNNKIIFIEEA